MEPRDQSGFTLIELLLSIGLVTILAFSAAPIYNGLQQKNDLDLTVTTVIQDLHRAQMLSQANDGDSQWGVKVLTGSVVVFKGATYAGRDSTYDEIYSTNPLITPSGVNEVVFAKMTGDAGTTGTITLATAADTKNITLNVKGMADY